jgi:2-polyprenyl-6-methoxyphenol hydroxylase-like FAD-dependent oxidoreductase
MEKSTSQVVVIGAGPTGLTLALLLARSGISSTLVEKHAQPQAHPAACILNTRTMEVFREIGVADLIMRQGQNVFEQLGHIFGGSRSWPVVCHAGEYPLAAGS